MLPLKPNIEKMEERRNVRGLIKALSQRNSHLRFAAQDALVRVGAPAVGGLCQALKDRDDYVRRVAAEALEKIGVPGDASA